ncbi:MAG: TonB-dependent receptor [Balneola sp.]|nr:TonB-dependent receptor [Balneola sp.]MBO6652149.1 TonB-dependent receptor [Balneola sp.]MBO6710138.1 TonB-dependent receptor [Balneola sp.]MBO6798822.1 TonB-dependent receptor [Balneola sp.]MBO6869936.1 TonB-dependent receptor [Balneola sp.]
MNIKKLLPVLFLLVSVGVQAQSGKITGKILDAETGEPLIGATVGIKGSTKGAVADIDGNYLMLNVAPGTYTLEARYIGYATLAVQEVIVRTDLTTEQDFRLELEAFEGEEIVVVATRQPVLKDVTSSESRVSSEEIKKLPVQEVSDVIGLQAGVSVDNGGGIHIRGGRTSEVSYVVDGIRVTDDYDRSNGVRIENESVQELQVISGSFNAEHGQALSGIVNVVTKSGGSQFDASVNAWTGSYMATAQSDIYDGIGTGFSTLNPNRMYNLSASVSGPIIKDKLTFFVTARRFENEGHLTGRNAFSPHGQFRDTLALGTDFDSYRTIYNERVDFSKPWYSIDTVNFQGTERLVLTDDGTRDSSLVNMNNYQSSSFQGNLEYRFSKFLKFNLIGSYGLEEGQGYDHQNKLVPLGRGTSFRNNYALNFKTTITPSSKTFLTINLANRYNEQKNHLYDDPWDPRYFNFDKIVDFYSPAEQSVPGAAQFSFYGTDNNRFFRSTDTFIGKAEVSSQVNENHYIKAGFNLQFDEVSFENISLVPFTDPSISFPPGTPEELKPFVKLGYPEINTPGYQKYSESPRNFSAYVQDKIEFDNLIINVGLRFDYFDPNSRVVSDLEDPDITSPTKQENQYRDLNNNGQQDDNEPDVTLEERQEYWFEDTSIKTQLSPRIGVAYPINDRGVIYFSYGYFFQVPSYNFMYTNSRVFVGERSGNLGLFGNPDLKPERSTQYELGLKQEIFDGTAIELTGYYKDTRDYVSSRPQVTGATSTNYGIYFNRDFSKSIGFTFAFNQYVSQRFNFGLDYTFSSVEGSNSDPSSEYFDIVNAGTQIDSTNQTTSTTKLIQPLNWDRTHIVNGSMFYSGNSWGANLVTKFSTGTPYTPQTDIPGVEIGVGASTRDLRNTSRLPTRLTVDLNTYKNINLPNGSSMELFLNVYNLLDSKVINNVYGDSGEATAPLPINTVDTADPGFYSNPSFYAEPRRIQLGLSISF